MDLRSHRDGVTRLEKLIPAVSYDNSILLQVVISWIQRITTIGFERNSDCILLNGVSTENILIRSLGDESVVKWLVCVFVLYILNKWVIIRISMYNICAYYIYFQMSLTW